jgi:hypothetical protein
MNCKFGLEGTGNGYGAMMLSMITAWRLKLHGGQIGLATFGKPRSHIFTVQSISSRVYSQFRYEICPAN